MKKLFLFTAVLFLARFSFAQWEPDVRLTNNSAISIAAAANTWGVAYSGDTVHVVWHDSRNGDYEIYYKRSTDNGVSWGADTRLTSNSAVSQYPGIAISGSALHISWEDTRSGAREIYYKHSLDGGQTWGSDVRVSNGNNNAFLSSIAVNGPNVHLAWQDERDGTEAIYYNRSTDGGATWGPEVSLAEDPTYLGLPSIAVSGSIVHIVWEDYRDGSGEIYYLRSADGGVNWNLETRLTNNTLDSWNPCVAVSGSMVHCTFMEDFNGGNYEIFYMRSINSGLTWEAPVRLSNNPAESMYPNIAADGQNVHIVWTDSRDGQKEIYYRKSTDEGNSWPGLEERLTSSAGISENPTVSTSLNTVHVVWDDNRTSNYEIYYKRDPSGNLQVGVEEKPSFVFFKHYSVSPNPASRQLTIGQMDNWTVGQSAVRLSIVDLFGREVKNIGQINALPYQIDISNLPDGVYLLRMNDSSGYEGMAKFVKAGN